VPARRAMNNPAIREQILDERLMQQAYFVLLHFLVIFVISAWDFGHIFPRLLF
jgi:hypothetical protein